MDLVVGSTINFTTISPTTVLMVDSNLTDFLGNAVALKPIGFSLYT
jgi:hypothetical protein